MRRRLLLAAPALLLTPPSARASEPPLAFVLDLDGSGSTSRQSQAWRRMADARHASLSHPAVIEAILRRWVRAMAASWGVAPTDALAWRDLRLPQDVARFADAVASLVPGGGSTSTGTLLAAMPGWLRRAKSHRPVLDVATDGEDDFIDADDRPQPGSNDHPPTSATVSSKLTPTSPSTGSSKAPRTGPGIASSCATSRAAWIPSPSLSRATSMLHGSCVKRPYKNSLEIAVR